MLLFREEERRAQSSLARDFQGERALDVNRSAGNEEMETVMEKRRAMGLVTGRQGVVCISAAARGQRTLREGTTGRMVSTTLPKVWAVAAGGKALAVVPGVRPGNPAGNPQPERAREAGVEVRFYRKYTEGLLRRYTQMSMEAGRVPSMLGREVMGGRASSYRIHAFDDAVNFRLDVEKCLRQLEPEQREVLRRVTMQEYTQAEAAAMMGVCLRTCVDRYGKALDRLTGILLKARILEPLRLLSMG